MRISDGKKIVEIFMGNSNDDFEDLDSFPVDKSFDFFDALILGYDSDCDFFIVDDVDYCIDQVREWVFEDKFNYYELKYLARS